MKITIIRTVAAAGIAATALLSPLALGQATATTPAPSACRPANHLGTVTPDEPSAGHHHYRVTLTAGPDTSACTLAGSPTGLYFVSGGGAPLGVSATTSGDQTVPVAFGPGAPVHFDIQVPTSAGGASAGSARFVLEAPGGVIPGESVADGRMEVDAGTQIGPVQPGA